jgi:hypothetical protein
MVPESLSRPALREVLVGRDSTASRRFFLSAVVALGVFGVLFALLAWNMFDEPSIFVIGVWVLLGGWTCVTPALNAYENDGLLVSLFLASVGPFAVGVVLALSPALTGPQRTLLDVLGFALELSLEFGLPVGTVAFAAGSWMRIALDFSSGKETVSGVSERYAVLLGVVFLLAVPVVKLLRNAPKDVSASPLDVALLGMAIVGCIVGLVLLGLLNRES